MDKQKTESSRNLIIIRTSIVGIAVNILLSFFKAAVGIMTNSIAVTLDAVNNISDAASGIITIIGTKLAEKAPDKKHPFGYGRIEYLSAMIISAIVLYAGITSFTESVKKIFISDLPDYSAVSLVIVAVGVVVKIVLGHYVKSVGKSVNSDSLVNSGEDAALDSIISASTLAAAVIYIIWHISLEAVLGAVISVVIIKSGVEMLKNTISQILGQSTEPRLACKIKETVSSFPEVYGAYDLIVHDYGPDNHQASVHIEVADNLSSVQIDELIRRIFDKVFAEHHIALTGVSVYALNTSDPLTVKARKEIGEAVMNIEHIKQLHGFYMNHADKNIRFDLVISLNAKDRTAVYKEALSAARALYPDYTMEAVMDTDYAEA